ncbi:hypothetical protein ACFY0G_17570 [Streptomyces sp. NPDC001552]|uniref:hypothetical protein n=1 Tax=Streptomyces sp. NPDC001552 TaxID=3364587 RepID=UPI00367C7B74
MFRETVVHAGGTTEGTASEAHLLMTLRRAVRRGYGIEATREGGALVTWTRAEYSGQTAERAVLFAPQKPVAALTEALAQDLHLINDMGPAKYEENAQGRRVIRVGFLEFSPMATAHLRARQMVATDQHGTVRLTMTARLSLLAAKHLTTTTEPGIGAVASKASCTCGLFTATAGDRDAARHLARLHRQDMAAEFVTNLAPAVTAAITA